RSTKVRDVTVQAADASHLDDVVAAVSDLDGIEVLHVSDRTFLMHLGGKIEIVPRNPVKTRDDLSMAYTPGVARVSRAIADDPSKVWTLTAKQHLVAVVTDGSAVLGLGDIGPEAAMPVMEGKAMLFKEFGGVDAFPICLATQDPDEIVAAVKAIAPGFGGINLEDIAAPRCFEVESRLQDELDIPVFHDDQHGTAIVVLAALLNALKVVGKELGDVRIVTTGCGAAGTAVTKVLLAAGATSIVGCDEHGALYEGRPGLDAAKLEYAALTNPERLQGTADEMLAGADVFIGVSVPGAVSRAGIAAMAPGAIVFALANPQPEIDPEVVEDIAAVIATGRSDYPNQINNVLAFPGVFRGALDVRARTITHEMQIAAARAIAEVIGPDELAADYIVPSVFDRSVAPAVARAVSEAAVAGGVARVQLDVTQ
ncbi:MAG TPA: NAD-dependent malic enzyme, partial [Gaiellaceae bacterium]|nr:NAD-dependent malic enzyme [Gaiellaceae bacterium]